MTTNSSINVKGVCPTDLCFGQRVFARLRASFRFMAADYSSPRRSTCRSSCDATERRRCMRPPLTVKVGRGRRSRIFELRRAQFDSGGSTSAPFYSPIIPSNYRSGKRLPRHRRKEPRSSRWISFGSASFQIAKASNGTTKRPGQAPQVEAWLPRDAAAFPDWRPKPKRTQPPAQIPNNMPSRRPLALDTQFLSSAGSRITIVLTRAGPVALEMKAALAPGIDRVEMRGWMVAIVETDNDPVKTANLWHGMPRSLCQ